MDILNQSRDIIFFPNKSINYHDEELLIYYFNPDSCNSINGMGCFEKGLIKKQNVKDAINDGYNIADTFIDNIWQYLNCNQSWGIYPDSDEYFEVQRNIQKADFINGISGDNKDEFELIRKWAICDI